MTSISRGRQKKEGSESEAKPMKLDRIGNNRIPETDFNEQPRTLMNQLGFVMPIRYAWPSEPRFFRDPLGECSREDSNLHGLPHTVLSRTRLPVPPRELEKSPDAS
jgi:hypothetical protein